jgi:hypothetical protein
MCIKNVLRVLESTTHQLLHREVKVHTRYWIFYALVIGIMYEVTIDGVWIGNWIY